MPTSSNMIGHIYITELVYKQKLYVWYSCCCYELRVITDPVKHLLLIVKEHLLIAALQNVAPPPKRMK